jgi:hypothetical protein
MPRRYVATYEYSEVVRGEPRDFIHETVLEAADLDAAKQRANRYFEELSFVSGVGWRRVLHRWKIAEAPHDAVITAGTWERGAPAVEE